MHLLFPSGRSDTGSRDNVVGGIRSDAIAVVPSYSRIAYREDHDRIESLSHNGDRLSGGSFPIDSGSYHSRHTGQRSLVSIHQISHDLGHCLRMTYLRCCLAYLQFALVQVAFEDTLLGTTTTE